MKEIIRFEVVDKDGEDTEAELMVDTESNVFELSILKGVEFEKVFSGDWSGNMQEVLQRALRIWKVEGNEEEIR